MEWVHFKRGFLKKYCWSQQAAAGTLPRLMINVKSDIFNTADEDDKLEPSKMCEES